MKLTFIGTGKFAVPILKALSESDDFLINLVLSEPAKFSGRRKEITPSPIGLIAEKLGLSLFTPQTLKDREVQSKILSSAPDVIVTVAYGKIIPREIFDTPPFKTINIHPSLLPELRGASPIQYALLKAKEETGTTLMLVDEELDAGDIISQEKIKINQNDNYDILEEKLIKLSIDMILRDLPLYISGKIKPRKQNHRKATFTKKIEKKDGGINWSESAIGIYNKWRAFYRWPGIFTFTQDKKRLNLKEISLTNTMPQAKLGAGVIFVSNGDLYISCANGLIQVHQIQPEGKRVMEAREFINGYKNLLNKKLN